ncbi:MAG: hypothetical protein K1X81_09815 [Bacteroidia bacterium]|nr:hypothetical protein [Bacteroidia bacterium]
MKKIFIISFLLLSVVAFPQSTKLSNKVLLDSCRLVLIEVKDLKSYHNMKNISFHFVNINNKDSHIVNYKYFEPTYSIGNFQCPFIIDSVYTIELERVCLKDIGKLISDNYYTIYMEIKQDRKADCSLLVNKKLKKVVRPKYPFASLAIIDYVDIDNYLFKIIAISPCDKLIKR